MALNNIDVQISAKANNARKEVNNLKNDMHGLKKETNGVGQSIKSAFKSGNIYGALQKSSILGWIGAIKNATQAMVKATKAESEYAESLNLLNVAYDNNTDSATKLISKLETMYGLDPAGLTKQLGIYKQMTNAMQMGSEASALLSENLLKMQEDVSSLYNLDIDVVASKFQSALAGQTRAVRSLGVDITQASLQQELYNRGIDKNVRELNRASKTALIYLAMERQLVKANGDAANTVDHLANQVRIFKEQIAIAARQISAVFVPVLEMLLPYLNGILMALNEIGKALLGLFGVDINEMAKASAGIGLATSGVDDLSDSLDGASKKSKKLNNQLRDFDRLNVITTQKDKGSSGSDSLSGGGIDPALWKQLKEYDLKDVSMRAQQIKDAFLEWLKVFKPLEEPFKKLSELTFDGLKYLWNEILKPVGKWANETLLPKVVETVASAMNAVYEVAKTMQPILYGIMENVVKPFGKILGKTIINILNGIKTAFDLISKSKILQFLVGSAGLVVGFTKLLSIGKQIYTWFGATKLGSIFKTFNGILIDAFKGTKNLKQGFKEYFDLVVNEGGKTATSIMGLKINTDALKSAISGAIQTALGISMVTAGIQDMQENGLTLMNTITLIAGAVEIAMGAVELFTGVIGTLKTLIIASNPFALITASILGTVGLVYALSEAGNKNKLYLQEIDKTNEAHDKFIEKLKKENEEIEKKYQKRNVEIETAKKYLEELKNITDENGKIRQGYEDRAKFIAGQLKEAYGIELNIVDGVLQKRKEELDILNKLIKKKEVEVYLDMQKEKYDAAIRNRDELLKHLNETYDAYTKTQQKEKTLDEDLKTAKEELQKATASANKFAIADAQAKCRKIEKELETERKAVEKTGQEYWKLHDEYIESTNNIMDMQEMWVAESEENWEEVIYISKNGGRQRNENTAKSLIEETRIIKDLGNSNVLAAWKDLALNNVEGYYNNMMELSYKERKIISDATGVVLNDKDFAQSWANLAEQSEDKFMQKFGALPKDIQQEVVWKMYQEGHEISSELQRGIQSINPSIKFKGDFNDVWKDFAKQLGIDPNGVFAKSTVRIKLAAAGINLKADGGFLNTGEVFVAREAGPELVGRIGNKTAVANNDQIVNSIAKGLAMSGINKETNVNIIAQGDDNGFMNYITFKQQQRERQYGM